MNYKKKLTSIFLIIIFSACSNKKIHINNTVEISPSVLDNNVSMVQSYMIGSGDYGPQPPENFLDYSNKNQAKTWGLVILPARARVFELIKFIKILEEKSLLPNA
jgi:hypothetical protein